MKPKIFKVTQTPKGLQQMITLQPEIAKEHYCAVVNVSDSPCATFDYQISGIPSFWFPINELAKWMHAPFFGTLKVVNEYYTGTKKVLIHCHAGANRSPSVAFAVLLAKGYTQEEAEESLEYPRLSLVFKRNIKRGHTPGDIVRFLMESDKNPEFSMLGILRTQSLLLNEIIEKKMKEQCYYDLSELGEKGHLIYQRDLKKYIVKLDDK